MGQSQFDDILNPESNLGWIFGDPFDQTFSVFPDAVNPSALSAETTGTDNHGDPRLEEKQLAKGQDISPLPDPTPQDRCSPNDPWPMEWHSTAAPCLVLPKLGNTGQEFHARHYPTTAIDSSLSAKLQETLRLPMLRSPWQPISFREFPSEAKLNHCIDMYFVHFQQILPIIHRPTFDPAKFPLVTLTMACIGACYTAFDGAKAFADALSEFNRRLLVFMVADHSLLKKLELTLYLRLKQIRDSPGQRVL